MIVLTHTNQFDTFQKGYSLDKQATNIQIFSRCLIPTAQQTLLLTADFPGGGEFQDKASVEGLWDKGRVREELDFWVSVVKMDHQEDHQEDLMVAELADQIGLL